MQTVENLTGIRIDHFVEIGMGGVVGIVDAVGGIEICPKDDYIDKDAGLNIKKGCQEVDGKTALAYCRSRHAQTLGDLDRVRHQREVVAAIGHKVLSPWSVLNPVRYWRLNNAMPDFFTFGEGMGPQRAVLWATAMAKVGGKDGLLCTVPLTNGSATALDAGAGRPAVHRHQGGQDRRRHRQALPVLGPGGRHVTPSLYETLSVEARRRTASPR